jgi:hypothetical protein
MADAGEVTKAKANCGFSAPAAGPRMITIVNTIGESAYPLRRASPAHHRHRRAVRLGLDIPPTDVAHLPEP